MPFFSVAQHIGRCTQTWHCAVHPFLFRMTVIVSIPFFRQGWDPIRADIPLFVDRDVFLQFLPILQPSCLHWHPTFVKGHGPQAIGCEVHVSLFDQPHLVPATTQASSKTDENLRHNVSLACRPGVFQIALFKGFLNIPHIPLPPEHSVGTNEATMAPTPETPESWHIPHRPREIGGMFARRAPFL